MTQDWSDSRILNSLLYRHSPTGTRTAHITHSQVVMCGHACAHTLTHTQAVGLWVCAPGVPVIDPCADLVLSFINRRGLSACSASSLLLSVPRSICPTPTLEPTGAPYCLLFCFSVDPSPRGSLTTLGSPCTESICPKTLAKAAGGNYLFILCQKRKSV